MWKRITVLILSFSTIIAYGYALGGLGSYAAGVPKPLPVIVGFVGGTVCAALALKVWRVYLAEIEEEDRRIMEGLLKDKQHKEDSDEKIMKK